METQDLPMLLCAIHSFAFAAFHLSFWKIFRWSYDLKSASLSARAMIQIFNLRLIYLFLGVGVLCLAFPFELGATRLGKAVMLGMSLFWVGRLIEQFVFLRYNHAMIHVLSAMFALGAILFAIPVFY